MEGLIVFYFYNKNFPFLIPNRIKNFFCFPPFFFDIHDQMWNIFFHLFPIPLIFQKVPKFQVLIFPLY